MRPCRRRPKRPQRTAHRGLVVAGRGLASLVLVAVGRDAGDLVGGSLRDAHHDLPRARRPRRHPARPRRRRRRDRRRRHRGRGPPRRPLRLRRAVRGAPRGRERHAEHRRRAAPTRCSAPAAPPTGWRCPTTSRSTIQTSSGTVQPRGRARVGADQHRLRRDRAPAASAASCCAPSSDSGDVRAVSECSADRLELRSRTGDVRAVVPAGRYQIDAQSDSGDEPRPRAHQRDDAPFQIQALSTSGDVSVEAAS